MVRWLHLWSSCLILMYWYQSDTYPMLKIMREILPIRNDSGSFYTIVYPTLASTECPRSWLWLSNPVACDVGISLTFSQPDIKIIPAPLCYKLWCSVASGIRMTLVSGVLKKLLGRREGPASKEVGERLTVFGTAHCTVVFMCRGRAMQAVPETLLETSMSTCAICELYIDPDSCTTTTCYVIKWDGVGSHLRCYSQCLLTDMCQR